MEYIPFLNSVDWEWYSIRMNEMVIEISINI